jgi:predicted RNA-binding Zn-ribbon protein involved in translation (DUF1610 family)
LGKVFGAAAVDGNGESDDFPFRCPSCHVELPKPPEDTHVSVVCPECGTSFTAVRRVARRQS